MVEGARVQATPSARILSPPRVAHNRGVTVSPPPPPVSSLCGPSGHPSHPHSPGLVFRLGVVVPGGLDTLLSHISKHRERGLHNEVDEACNADNTRTRLTLGGAQRTRPARQCPQLHRTVTWGSRAPSGGNLCDDVCDPRELHPSPPCSSRAACLDRNGDWELSDLAQPASLTFPNPLLPAGRDTHQSGTAPRGWKCGHRAEKRAGPARPPCHPGGADRAGTYFSLPSWGAAAGRGAAGGEEGALCL